ncbi:MAG: ATP-binding cassette domain-containing protein, partial [Hydrogenophaga sp.]
MKHALQTERIGVELGGAPVLHGIDMALPAARWTSIVGPNGAGKSTLLKALAGLLPHSGQVLLMDRPLAQWRGRERARCLAWL